MLIRGGGVGGRWVVASRGTPIMAWKRACWYSAYILFHSRGVADTIVGFSACMSSNNSLMSPSYFLRGEEGGVISF